MCSVAVQAGSGTQGKGGRQVGTESDLTEGDGVQEDKGPGDEKGDAEDKSSIPGGGGGSVDVASDNNSLPAARDSGKELNELNSDASSSPSSYVVPVSIAMTTTSTTPVSHDLDIKVVTPPELERPTFSVCVPAMDWRVQPFGQVLGMKALPITGILPAPVERDAAVQPKRRVRME